MMLYILLYRSKYFKISLTPLDRQIVFTYKRLIERTYPCEPVELTEFELDAVAGGNPFSINVEAAFSKVRASVRASFENESTNSITNLIDNSANVSGP